ncbi:stage IV sporulation protein B [Fictibacillus macauensis ZFHKF-1]|uniref:Stage IV sporulation protein B n=1 Tax=Fictibacillus macauensis ZFHKF-1 TaxID=1196324 RepID=I8UKG6_9BACL|nr:SpoIVB peptidase [Fictibacillus macauensis]EIT87318.1 stage IV sporulation protein B [Fictibacillus macauensis ZFHKF-1]
MVKDYIRRIFGVILLGCLVGIGFLQPVRDFINVPQGINIFSGDQRTISNMPAGTHVSVGKEDASRGVVTVGQRDNQHSFSVNAHEDGDSVVTLEAGHFPMKKMAVRSLPELKVVPGGQSIGVKLNTLGVLVVGHHLVNTKKGQKSPGEIANIQIGDIITKINGQSITKMGDVAPFVKQAGKTGEPLNVTVIRQKKTYHRTLTPLQDKNDLSFRIGLYIRDSAAGVGTLTFYQPDTFKYGALGHVISDMDTKQPIVVNNGEILNSTVTSIEKGSNGHPGEKLARFSNENESIGGITRNSPFGIFGKLNSGLSNGKWDQPMSVAFSDEVKEGPAQILTVVDGTKVQAFNVEVVSSVPQKFPAIKGMVIKVTDPKLLKKTGGIVQGMSGSPIIQNGKLIGAVTHVFVNDPTSGYGVHIEWMLEEAGIKLYGSDKQRAG